MQLTDWMLGIKNTHRDRSYALLYKSKETGELSFISSDREEAAVLVVVKYDKDDEYHGNDYVENYKLVIKPNRDALIDFYTNNKDKIDELARKYYSEEYKLIVMSREYID